MEKQHELLESVGVVPLPRAGVAGAVAGAHCWVEELPGCAPDAHSTAYGDGWDGAVDRALDVLVSTVDSAHRQRGRARVTRSLLNAGEILANRRAAADQAAVADPVGGPSSGEE
ncbi:hypothetical protein [Streptomyces sp. NPDC060022]|uniref:hypothetical protein n=1 Tax=Streptomyces sp. NPDC060022 TaxID=3347039 RepID=UPI0036AF17F3